MTLSLAAEFPSPSRERWLKLVEGVLKGGDFETLVSRSYDGIRVEPLYEKSDPAAQPVRAAHGPWTVVQRVDHPDPSAANELALADLTGGADALAFVYAGSASARGFGIEAGSVDDLDRALRDVMLDLIEVRLETAAFQGPAAAAQWLALAERRKLDPAALGVDFGLDPIGDMARIGASPARSATDTAEIAQALREAGFTRPIVRVDTRPYHEAGAGEAQELAAALATGIAYLRALEGGRHGVAEARDALSFLLVADADEFLTIAKFRALRRLWARVEEACRLPPRPLRLHAETAWRMATRCDPWVNLLRATVATFSAGIGGADSITVLPFTTALGLPDAFARRIARNTPLVLLEEANLWRVADPAAGAGGFEALTEALCEQAWSLFQEIESEGGIVASLGVGALQQRIAAVRVERERAIATRRDPLTGTSEFPNLHEAPVSVLLPSPFAKESREEGRQRDQEPGSLSSPASRRRGKGIQVPAPLDIDVSGSPSAPPTKSAPAGDDSGSSIPLPSLRLAEPYERLRDASDEELARTGARPRVFLANLGPVAAFTARASFAKNFFEAGGIEAPMNDGFASHEEMAAACESSGCRLACLCASDEVYASEAVAAAQALRNAGASAIFLAGRPRSLQDALRSAGVEHFIFAGCDALAILNEAARQAAQPVIEAADRSS